MTKNKWKPLLLSLAKEANELLQTISGGADIVHQGGDFGDLHNDTEIHADKAVGELMISLLKDIPGIAWIIVEGIEEPVRCDPNGTVVVYVDPLDASLDYATAVRIGGKFVGLPFTLVITVIEKSELDAPHKFGSTVAAMVYEFGCDTAVYADKETETVIVRKPGLTGWLVSPTAVAKVFSNADTEKGIVNPGAAIYIIENYYTENRDFMYRAFKNMKGYIRSVGSAAWEMAIVALGIVAAHACHTQKGHESPAAWLLVTQAGGVAISWDGQPLKNQIHDFHKQKDVIFACNELTGQTLANMMSGAMLAE